MTPEKLSITVDGEIPGDDWRWVLPIMGFTPQPGDAARAHVRSSPGSDTIVLSFSTADGTIEMNDGEIVMSAASIQTASVAPGRYVWDFEMTREGKIETIFVACTLNVLRDITRGA